MLDMTKDKEPQILMDFTSPPAVEVDWRVKVPTVSEVNRRIRGHIENSFFDVWVRGEVSTFRKPVSGHAYFVVKDNTSQLKAVMFKGQLAKLKFQLKEGMEVLLHGSVSVYEARGEYQIVCDTAEPVGVGALQLAFEQLKAKLNAEGLFDPKHKKALPSLPKRIGIVTSATGAAVKDILKVLSRRYPDRKVIIFPASVQGDKAAPEIVAAIKKAERWNTENPTDKVDVLIVGRGGGSMEDLWPFNEEIVARALYACPIPTISAVGHEIDFTISDFVCDLRAPTPSAAAEVVVPKKEELVRMVGYHQTRLNGLMTKKLEQLRLHLGHLTSRLLDPRQRIRQMQANFNTLMVKLTIAMQSSLRLKRQRLESRIQMLDSLSPLQVIGRGFSLTMKTDGSIIRSVKSVKKGEKLTTRLADGILHSEVISD